MLELILLERTPFDRFLWLQGLQFPLQDSNSIQLRVLEIAVLTFGKIFTLFGSSLWNLLPAHNLIERRPVATSEQTIMIY